ncbi:MAG TPA: hypothetical protein VFO40_24055 [Chthoniobacterales bacterium]|nr:hypothetical protein [Chthoniobacterales bacterium]
MNLELIDKTALISGSAKGMATGTEGTGLSNGNLYFPKTFWAPRGNKTHTTNFT